MIIEIRDEAHWHEMRAKHVGGSEIGALFGQCSYTTPFELYHLKRGNRIDTSSSPLMEFGNDIEPVIAKWVAKEMGWDVNYCSEYYEHPEYPWLGCTLDYYVTRSEHGEGILEIKNVSEFSPGWTDTRAPAYVELQVQQQLMVVDAARKAAGLKPFNWAAIGSMRGGNPEGLRVMMRQHDAEVQKAIIKKTKAFWQRVEQGNEPRFDAVEDHPIIQKMWQQAEPIPVELHEPANPEDVDALVTEYVMLGKEISKLEKKRKAAQARIYDEMTVEREKPGKRIHAMRGEQYAVEIAQQDVNYKARKASTNTTWRMKVHKIEHTI